MSKLFLFVPKIHLILSVKPIELCFLFYYHSDYFAFQKLESTTWSQFLCEISKKAEKTSENPRILRQSSAIYGDNWLANVWRYLVNLRQIPDPVQELFLIKTK